jgi:hypothetical protein
MIKTVIRLENNMVMVFDESGEEIPEYQGYYHVVKANILADAAAGSVFNHWFGFAQKPYEVEMKCW